MRKGFELFVIIIFLFALSLSAINATEYCVNPILTNVSPSAIGIDEEFTVGILLDNCGNLAPNTILFELKDISEEIYIKEPLFRNITNIGYAADRFLVYHMKTSGNIKPGDYYLNYRVKYSGAGGVVYSRDGYFIITVIGDEAKLSIASAKTNPTLPREKEVVELTLRIENFGDGTANSIKVELEHPFAGTKEAFIGTLNPDEDGPAIFNFVVNKAAQYAIPVTISYQDDFGEKEIKTKVSIYIEEGDSIFFYVILVMLILAIIGWLVIYIFKIKKSKDKIIHQLLTDNQEKVTKKVNAKRH